MNCSEQWGEILYQVTFLFLRPYYPIRYPFADYALYPTDSKMEDRVTDASNTVEEAALDGWIRGG